MRVLFSGYAPIHFVCFKPLYDYLSKLPGVEIVLSGGMRSPGETTKWVYDEKAMYQSFNLPSGVVQSVEAIREMDFDVLFTTHTKLILPRSVGKIIQIFHGISFRNKAVRPENMGCDHYFLVGPYMQRRFTEAGLLAADDPRAVPIGFMKTDRLLNGELDRNAILKDLGFSGSRPILLYAPTGAHHNSLEIMGEAVIRKIKAAGKYDIVVKPHDHPKNHDIDWFQTLAPLEDAHCRITREPDIIRLMCVADLMISDASSAANEFTLLDRPLIFLDTPELLAAARDADNSALDLDTWGRKAGLVVNSPEEICSALDVSLRYLREPSHVRQAMASDFFFNPGRATDTAISWVKRNLLDARNQDVPEMAVAM